MGVIIPGDFKVVHIKRNFALNVFVLTRFHCIVKIFVGGSIFVVWWDFIWIKSLFLSRPANLCDVKFL